MVVTGHTLLVAIATWEELAAVGGELDRLVAEARLKKLGDALRTYQQTVLARIGNEEHQRTLSEIATQRAHVFALRQRGELGPNARIYYRRRLAEMDAALADGHTVKMEIPEVERELVSGPSVGRELYKEEG